MSEGTTNVAVKIVFEASLGWTGRFEPYTVSLGGTYPDIEIEPVADSGRYLFKIRKTVPNHGVAMIRSVAVEAEAEIQAFWNVLTYLRDDTIVRLEGPVQYEHEGVLRQVEPERGRMSGATMTTGTTARWFELNVEAFNKRYNYDLMKRFNFARGLVDPVSRFLSLYAMLSTVAEDKQAVIDRLIHEEEPTVAWSPSKDGRPETIFTRLRNELAHYREGVSAFRTHDEISLHIARFEWLVGRIVRPRVEAPRSRTGK